MRRWIWLVVVVLACRSSSAPDPESDQPTCPSLVGITLPEVGPNGYALAGDRMPTITVTMSELALVGVPLVKLTDGELRYSDMPDGLVTMLAATTGVLDPSLPVLLGFDNRVPYQTLHSIVQTLGRAGHVDFALLARSGERVVAAPIRMRPREAIACGVFDESKRANKAREIERAMKARYRRALAHCFAEQDKPQTVLLELTVDATGGARTKATGPAPDSLKQCIVSETATWRFKPARLAGGESFEVFVAEPAVLERVEPLEPRDPHRTIEVVISAWEDGLHLWSRSGYEGTPSSPKLVIPLDDPSAMISIRNALVDIATRRQPAELQITLRMDSRTSMQTVAELIATVRATADGRPLFPDIMLD